MESSNLTIISNIKRILTKKDKNNNEYLVIKTDNPHVIFVFPRVIPIEEWEQLKVGQSYQFTLQSSHGDTYTLHSFTRSYTFEFSAEGYKTDKNN